MLHRYPLLAALCIALTLATSWSASAQGVIPTDNPYRTHYQPQGILPPYPYHWTDSLPWGRVFNIQRYVDSVRLVRDYSSPNPQDQIYSWYFAIRQALRDIDAAGGGVLYFPKLPQRTLLGLDGTDSSYFCHESIYVHSNTVLRGEDPAVANATDRNYSPPSWLEFPQYNYTIGRGQGGTPNNTAFKEIANDPADLGAGHGASNVAIVNLDINRALIGTYGSFNTVSTSGGNASRANENMRNWLVFGVRSNNVALPDPGVPQGSQNPSSRWSWRFAANVLIFAGGGNIVVANNRINDAYLGDNGNTLRTINRDDFDQPDYTTRDGSTCLTSGDQSRFQYNSHYGIIVNRIKRDGYATTQGFLANADASVEPSHFARGNAVLDNYIFHTGRSGIHCSGYGLVVRGNQIKDDINKITQYLDPTGQKCNTNQIPVTDVGGIDFTGWGSTIEYNQVEMYRNKFNVSPSGTLTYSADGNPIYSQGPGGTTVKDVTIRHNTVIASTAGLCAAINSGQGKGFIGCSNSAVIENVRIDSNDCGGVPIVVDGNNGAQTGVASNILVRYNTNVRGLTISGVRGGNWCYAYGNSGATTPLDPAGPNSTNCLYGTALGTVIRRTCQVALNPDNTNPDNNQNTGLTPSPATCIQVTCTICGESAATNWPRIRIVQPSDSIVSVAPPVTNYLLGAHVVLSGSNCTADSVVVFINGVRVGLATYDTPSDNYQFAYNYAGSATVSFTDNITFVAYKGTDNGCGAVAASTSRGLHFIVTDIKKRSAFAGVVKAQPNPATDRLSVTISSARTGAINLRLLDLAGREAAAQTLLKSGATQTTSLSITNLPQGTYLLEVSDSSGRYLERIVKE